MKWFYDIYLERVESGDGEIVENKWTNQLQWERVKGSYVIIFNSVFGIYFFFLGYNWANMGGLNTGVLMSVYSIKPIFMSILFYAVFRQTLKWFEFIGISL